MNVRRILRFDRSRLKITNIVQYPSNFFHQHLAPGDIHLFVTQKFVLLKIQDCNFQLRPDKHSMTQENCFSHFICINSWIEIIIHTLETKEPPTKTEFIFSDDFWNDVSSWVPCIKLSRVVCQIIKTNESWINVLAYAQLLKLAWGLLANVESDSEVALFLRNDRYLSGCILANLWT